MSEKEKARDIFKDHFRREFWFGDSWPKLLGKLLAWSLNWVLFLGPAYIVFLGLRWLAEYSVFR